MPAPAGYETPEQIAVELNVPVSRIKRIAAELNIPLVGYPDDLRKYTPEDAQRIKDRIRAGK